MTRYRESTGSKIGVIVLSSLYFALAHVYFTVEPFRLTHIDYLQLVTAFACGVFYATAFLRTKSLLAPFLAHNFANTSATICGYIISSM
jgi:membrane protease YdiL (CAAX protease family)